MKLFKNKILRIVIRIILFPIFFCISYLIIAVLFSIFPVGENPPEDGEIEIYLTSNGLHADFIIPFKNDITDWGKFINPKQYSAFQYVTPQYISFGWGDRGFYLAEGEWDEISLEIKLKALFLYSETVMHVSLWPGKPLEYSNTVKFKISKNQYETLINFIKDSFRNDLPILIPEKGYSKFDNFYEAKGSYTFIYTCNTWVNEGLRNMNIKTALWTPFEQGIFYHFE